MAKDSDKDYYEKGSDQVAEVTAIQLKKLEQRRALTTSADLMVIVLVGLPGRGKSFIARKLQTFLTWHGNECKVFNVGKYRRQVQAEHEKGSGACDANFFDAKNPQAAKLRQEAASLALKDMLNWLDVKDEKNEKLPPDMWASKAKIQKSRVAIFDATNSSHERRKWVLEECTSPAKRGGNVTGCVFVESVCDDEELLEENFRFKVRNSPDYKDMTEEEAIADLRKRVKKYEDQYETIEDDSLSYIKVFNLSSKLLVNHIYGRMAKVIVPSLMSWNIGSRSICLCRSGHTDKPGEGSPTGNPRRKFARGEMLGPEGLKFRDCLEDFIVEEGLEFASKKFSALAFAPKNRDLGTALTGIADPSMTLPGRMISNTTGHAFSCHVMTSTMPRAVQTASWETYPFPINELPNLNPLDKGDFTGIELDEIAEKHPEWYAMLEEDPFLTRFPGGECYGDLIHRLETCIIDMEQQVNMVLVVSHVSVIQVLLSYFRQTPVATCTSNEVPMNTVIKFTPVSGGGWTESQHKLCESFNESFNEETHSQASSGADGSSSEQKPQPIWGDNLSRQGSIDYHKASSAFF